MISTKISDTKPAFHYNRAVKHTTFIFNKFMSTKDKYNYHDYIILYCTNIRYIYKIYLIDNFFRYPHV